MNESIAIAILLLTFAILVIMKMPITFSMVLACLLYTSRSRCR